MSRGVAPRWPVSMRLTLDGEHSSPRPPVDGQASLKAERAKHGTEFAPADRGAAWDCALPALEVASFRSRRPRCASRKAQVSIVPSTMPMAHEYGT